MFFVNLKIDLKVNLIIKRNSRIDLNFNILIKIDNTDFD